ncbi:MAG: TonB-dependent receptor [Neisseriaceae bacterium]|nr:TonB-dependent receptor [Neisseriaceae bacterium]
MSEQTNTPSLVLGAAVLGGLTGYVVAAESSLHEAHLETVTVIGRPVVEAPGGLSVQDAAAIARQPSRDGTLSDLLKANPNVQFGNDSDGSDMAGELAPANVSFHGEKFYHNYFALDGLSNNDGLNPAHNEHSPYLNRGYTSGHYASWLPPGHPQAFWVSPKLLSRVSVYDSNVPARYGAFTGGVVDAELLKPDLSRAFGSVTYRTSRDNWTRYYLDGDYAAEFQAAESPLAQPKFTKQQYGLVLNQPWGAHTGFLFGYDRQQSRIPLHHRYLKEWTTQKRLSETLLFKALHDVDAHNQLNLTALYSPHSGHYDPDNVRNGRFKHSGGGWRVDGDWGHEADWGQLDTKLAYRRHENRLNYDAANLYRYRPTQSIDWITDPNVDESVLGGLGDSRSEHKSLTFKQDVRLTPMTWGRAQHEFSGGWALTHGQARFNRPYPTLIYGGAVETDVQHCVACIPGEQYFESYIYNYAVSARANSSDVAVYGQDQLSLGHWTLHLGARLGYGRFLKNVDLAPRFAFDYDVLGRDQTHVFGGINRYYAGDLLTYQLRSAFRLQDNHERDGVDEAWRVRSPWEPLHGMSDLKTPYSDELNLGVRQKIGNSEWQLKWVGRQGKQQFMREGRRDPVTRQAYYELNNKGRSDSDTFTLIGHGLSPIAFQGANLKWRVGLDYNRRKNNQTKTFDQNSWDFFGADRVILDGNIVKPEDLPAMDFNQPWRVFLELDAHIPSWRLNWTQRFRYLGANKHYDQTEVFCPWGEPVLCQDIKGWTTRYDQYRQNGALVVDWSFNWLKPLGAQRSVSIDLDVLNVLNQKVVAKRIHTPAYEHRLRDVAYQSGRQFWLGLGYHW